MRKLLILSLCMFFSTAAVAQPSIDAVLKFGAAPASQLDNDERYDGDPGYSISPEIYYYFNDYLGIGIGFNQMFDRKIQDKSKLNSSNVYFTVRPKLKVIEKEYVYVIGQIGYGYMRHDFEVNNREVLNNAGGLYYGIGGGVDIHNFIFELLFTSIKATFESVDSNYEEEDEYTMMTINIGYRFSLPVGKKEKKFDTVTEPEPF